MPKYRNKSRSINPVTGKPLVTRIDVKLIEAGSDVYCQHCGERVKFQAKVKGWQMIINVFDKQGRWQGIEHYHSKCYKKAGSPHGPAPVARRRF